MDADEPPDYYQPFLGCCWYQESPFPAVDDVHPVARAEYPFCWELPAVWFSLLPDGPAVVHLQTRMTRRAYRWYPTDVAAVAAARTAWRALPAAHRAAVRLSVAGRALAASL